MFIFIMNIFAPGLGSSFGGRGLEGLCQMFMFFMGWEFVATYGIYFMLLAFMWAMYTSLSIMEE